MSDHVTYLRVGLRRDHQITLQRYWDPQAFGTDTEQLAFLSSQRSPIMETFMSIPADPAPITARKWPLLDPKNDAVFKMMFASPRGRRPLIARLTR